LLGPNVDPDLIRRCDIMFPDGDVTTFGFKTGSEEPRSRCVAGENSRGWLSVGVGGVFTIVGAGSPGGGGGGVEGTLVFKGRGVFPVRGRSGEEFAESPDACCGDCVILSGNMDPILDATLPLLLSDGAFSFSLGNWSPPPLLSGLDCGLGARFPGRSAFFNLRAGDGDRFWDESVGARRVFAMNVGSDSEEARLSDLVVEAAGETSPSDCDSKRLRCTVSRGTVVVCMRGDEVVR